MRHVSIFIAAVVLLACAACGVLFGPGLTIQVQGQVTAADDGSPIAGASVSVGKIGFTGKLLARVQTNSQGDYLLSFIDGSCSENLFTIGGEGTGLSAVAFFRLGR